MATPDVVSSPEYINVSVFRLKPEDTKILFKTSPSATAQSTEANYGSLPGPIVKMLLEEDYGDIYVIRAGNEIVGHASLIRKKLPILRTQVKLEIRDLVSNIEGRPNHDFNDHRDAVEPPGMFEFEELVIKPDERGKKYSREGLELILNDFEKTYGHHEMFAWIRADNISARDFNKVGWCLTRFQGEPLKEDLREAGKGKFVRSNESNLRADTRVQAIENLPEDLTPEDICGPNNFGPSKKRRFIVPMEPGEQTDLEESGKSHWALKILKKVMKTGKDPIPGKDPIISGVFSAEEMRTAGLPAQDGILYLYLTRDWNWKEKAN